MVPRVRAFILFLAALGVVIALLVAVGAAGAASAGPAATSVVAAAVVPTDDGGPAATAPFEGAAPATLCAAAELDSLASLVVDPAPWLHLEANSEQRSPVYLGATPRELQFGLDPVDEGLARLPESLRELGEEQLHVVWQSLVGAGVISTTDPVEIEGWPVHDDRARFTWAFARWRLSPDDPWRWLTTDAPRLSRLELYQDVKPPLYVPVLLDPLVAEDHIVIFGDPDDDIGWHSTPVFAECIWAERAEDRRAEDQRAQDRRADDQLAAPPVEAWLSPSLCDAYAERPDLGDFVALRIPQPARLNGAPVTYRFAVDKKAATMPADIVWTAQTPPPGPEEGDVLVASWPEDMLARYVADVVALDGEADAVYPVSGRRETFTIKNNAQPHNQLLDMVEYLEERYVQLGLRTWRQTFTWRDRTQVNLVAEIPGSDPSLAPVLMADHYDTAFDEDLAMEDIWVSVPGADDNCSATAAVLRAAEILPAMQPRRTIWLVHLTGEEFPSDCLGARHLVSSLLADGQEIHGLVLLDMIGFTPVGDMLYQISPGGDAGSEHIASVIQDVSGDVSPELELAYRTRNDDRSYLYNTDGINFSEAGFPVVLINEHVNWYTRIMRAGYHDMRDTISRVHLPYALAITRVSIETVARLAEARPQ